MNHLPSNQTSLDFRKDIQGLRAVCVVAVILFHMDIPGFGGGFVGVDVFFAISGYLMASVIARDVDRGTFRFSSFYARRAVRILPALFVTILLTFIASWFVLFPKNFEDLADVMAASVLFLANAVLMNQSSGYFAETLENHPLLHTWSLAVEEQFYLIFPVFFVFVSTARFLWLAPVSSLVLIVSSLYLAELYFEVSPSATFFHLPARIFEFFFGVLGFLYTRHFYPNYSLGRIGQFIGLALILLSFTLFDEETPVPSIWLLFPLSGALLVFISSDRHALASSVLSARPLVFIGGISFSLYLIHQPVLALLRYKGIEDHLSLSLSMLVSVPIAWVMKIYVEDFCRYRVNRRSVFYLLAGIGVLNLSLALAVKAYDGLTQRFDGVLSEATATAIGSPFRERCHTDGEDYLAPTDACRYYEGGLTWAVLGDSHAVPIAYSLAQNIQDSGESLVHLTFSGCGFHKPSSSHCRRWLAEAEEFLLKESGITNVVLSFRLMGQLYGRHEDVYPSIPKNKSDTQVRAIINEYVSMIRRLEKSGKRVIWVMQPPELAESMVTNLSKISGTNSTVSSVRFSWWARRVHDSPKLISERVPDGTLVVWPEDILCDKQQDTCYAIKDGVSLYRDRDHLSLEGAKLVVENIRSSFDVQLDPK